MKTIILILLLFFTANLPDGKAGAQTVWYVDRDATGGDTGRDWANAWKDLDSLGYWTGDGVNWEIIQPGDTIYISGGTDSTTYTPESIYGFTMIYSDSRNYTFASGNPVVITRAWHPNHNGDVIFSTSDNDHQWAVWIKNISNIKFIDFTFTNQQNAQLGHGAVIVAGNANGVYDSLLTFENCHFIGNGAGSVFNCGTTKLTLKNCIIESLQNSFPNDQDLLAGSSGNGGHIIDNCKIIYRNSYEAVLDTNLTDGAGMTTTIASLSDTDLSMETDYHINNSIWIGGYYLQITGNNSNTFFGSAGWEFETVNRTSPITTTPTSFTHTSENFPANGYVNAYLICDGDTLIITSNTGYTFTGTGGWFPSQPANGTYNWQIVGGELPGDGTNWIMGGAHRDLVQLSNQGDLTPGTWSTSIFSNNLFIDDSELGTGWNAMNYFVAPSNIRILYYNNIIVQRKINTSSTGIWMRTDAVSDPLPQSGIILNNTIIIKGRTTSAINIAMDTLISKNNLIVIDTATASTTSLFYSATVGTWKDINYNYYAKLGGAENGYFAVSGPAFDYTGWLGQGFDANSSTANSTNVSFANKYGLNLEDYYTTSGRDLGVDLSAEYPFLAYDALGNARSGSWDIGALEYIEPAKFRKAIFLHRSTGANVYGPNGSNTSVPEETYLYNIANSYTGEDSVFMDEDLYPAIHTNNFWCDWDSIFSGTGVDDISPYIESEDNNIIIIKTCYTGSGLYGWWYDGPQDTINYPCTPNIYVHQWHVRKVVREMAKYPNKFFVIWNLVPVLEAPGFTPEYDRMFSDWMKDTLATGLDATYGVFPPNVYIFDIYNKLALESGFIDSTYTVSSTDNHLNAAGTELIAPSFVEEVFDAAIAYESVYSPGAGWTPPDTTGTVSFTPVTNAELNSYHIAYGVVSEIDSTSHVYTATSDSFAVNYPFTLDLSIQEIENGDTIAVSNTASGLYSTANVSTIVVSGTNRTFTVTTKAEPPSTTSGIAKGSDGVIWKDSTGKIIKVQE